MAKREDAARSPGPEPEHLSIPGDWEAAVRKAVRKPIPPGGIPERPKRETAKNETAKKGGA